MFENISVKYDSRIIHNQISFDAFPGELIAMPDPSESEKSTLLQTFLNKTEITTGRFFVAGNISYYLKILRFFLQTCVKIFYLMKNTMKKVQKKIVKFRALEEDFLHFSSGERILVCKKETTLSGGQKVRVNLARAVYRSADIYLLDDPLAAVLIHKLLNLGIFEKMKRILGFLKEKCVFVDRYSSVLGLFW